ncbi:MAG: cytochrome c maturation protein CcmE [Anaerolineae bacterium]
MQKRSFLIAGVLIITAVIYLIASNTGSTASFFMTIEELEALGADAQGRRLTVSGAVIGETIEYDQSAPRVTFTMVQIPGDLEAIEAADGLAGVLRTAVQDPSRSRLQVTYDGVKPDLLKSEAQAIVRGQLRADGIFYADDLLLKCPSKYAEDLPEQVED